MYAVSEFRLNSSVHTTFISPQQISAKSIASPCSFGRYGRSCLDNLNVNNRHVCEQCVQHLTRRNTYLVRLRQQDGISPALDVAVTVNLIQIPILIFDSQAQVLNINIEAKNAPTEV